MSSTNKRQLSLTNAVADHDLKQKMIFYSQQLRADLLNLERKKMDIRRFIRHVKHWDDDISPPGRDG